MSLKTVRPRLATIARIGAAGLAVMTLSLPTSASAQTSSFAESPTFWFGDGQWSVTQPCCGIVDTLSFGTAGDTPLASSEATIGIWRPSDQRFRFPDENGTTIFSVKYGAAGDVAFTGRVGSSDPQVGANRFAAGIGIWRPADKTFRFDWNLDGRTDRWLRYGTDGDVPFTGDFNNDGQGDIAVWRPADGRWRIDWNLDGRTDRTIAFGTAGDRPMLTFRVVDTTESPDFNMALAVYRPSDGKTRIDSNLDGRTDETQVVDASALAELGDATPVWLFPNLPIDAAADSASARSTGANVWFSGRPVRRG